MKINHLEVSSSLTSKQRAIAFLKLLYKGWIKFGEVLGFINSRIIMGLFFILVMTPIAIFFRLIRRDFLQLRIKEDWKTYRVMSTTRDPKHMENSF